MGVQRVEGFFYRSSRHSPFRWKYGRISACDFKLTVEDMNQLDTGNAQFDHRMRP